MDGLYKLNLKTKMGDFEGFINIVTQNNELSGYLEVLGNKTQFSGGKVDGNNLYVSGKAKAGFFTIKYDIHGVVKDSTIEINAKTNMGSFETTAYKVS